MDRQNFEKPPLAPKAMLKDPLRLESYVLRTLHNYVFFLGLKGIGSIEASLQYFVPSHTTV